MAETQGRCIDFDGADDWDQVGIVGYRRRRNMLEFAIDLASQDQGGHKWASLEKTHVFPVRPVVDFVFVRGAVAGGCGSGGSPLIEEAQPRVCMITRV